MIKNKLESLKSGKFAAFKMSGLGIDIRDYELPQKIATKLKDGTWHSSDKFQTGKSQCYRDNAGNPIGDLYYYDDNGDWIRIGNMC
jgi:hypothetical protein